MKKFSIILASVLTLGGLGIIISSFITSPAGSNQDGYKITVPMTGAQEAPNAGDPDGSGTATFTLNSGLGTIEYTLTVRNIEPATAAHIHIAPAGSAGSVVVGLTAPANGTSSGVAQVDKEVIKAIRKNPSAYYVNVHNATYPGGAVRGQLSK
ncbi:MAG: CHRD domain-containing protein [Bacteroidota bacterium]